jgi:hypothetical protein
VVYLLLFLVPSWLVSSVWNEELYRNVDYLLRVDRLQKAWQISSRYHGGIVPNLFCSDFHYKRCYIQAASEEIKGTLAECLNVKELM